MPNPALKQIAKLRGCSVEEARAFCVQVQRLCEFSPSFQCIAQAVQQLEHQSYTEQDVAQLATKLHASQSRVHGRSKPIQSQIHVLPKFKPSQLQLGVPPALEHIAELQGCSVEEAAIFCLQVRELCEGLYPSFESIAHVIQQLEHQVYTEQDVAQLVANLHRRKSRVRVHPKPKPSQFDHPFLQREWKKPVRVRPEPKPSQSRISPTLKRIAESRGCNVEEAHAFCVQVQRLCEQAPSFKCIAEAVQQLEHQSYTLQDVAQLAKKLHPKQQRDFTMRTRVRVRPKQQPGFTRLQDQVRTELASPDFKEGTHGLAIHHQDLKQFLHRKWQEITSIERSFGLAQDQAHEVEVAVGLLNRLGVERLRFRQQGFTSPAVGVDFLMQHEVVCQCAVDTTGQFQPHPELDQLFPADYQLLLNLAAVVHYADLVVPREPMRSQPATSTTESPRLQGFSEGTTAEPPPSVHTKRIPRLKPSTASRRAPHSRVTAPKRPSRVDPFRRRLPAGQKPSFAKIVEADQAGISLQGPGYPDVQYTFVRAHIRGGGDAVPQYVYADYQAVKTFEHLLNVLGFP